MTGTHSARIRLRNLLRVAHDIHEAFVGVASQPAAVTIPEYTWNELLRLNRMAELARERRFSAAANEIGSQMIVTMQSLAERLRYACAEYSLTQYRATCVMSVHDVYRDLCSLQDEFDDVWIDGADRTITVRTEPIVLDELNLGPFDILLHWSQSRRDSTYEVLAVNPVTCVQDDSVTHPHVRDNCLCSGDGKAPIARALQEGRLLEFFILVRQVLMTYSPASAYQQIREWFDEDETCSDCGCCLDEDSSYSCDRCGSATCGDCNDTGHVCDGMYCRQCTDACSECDEYVCGACSEENADRNGRRCRDCIEAENDSETTPTEETHVPPTPEEETQTEETPADTEVPARCVVEALVSA
jgi:hypothetical protein